MTLNVISSERSDEKSRFLTHLRKAGRFEMTKQDVLPKWKDGFIYVSTLLDMTFCNKTAGIRLLNPQPERPTVC